MSIQAVLLIGAGRVRLKHLLIIRKLCDVLRRVTKRVVHGLIRAHGEHHIGAPACQHCVQQRIRSHDFHVDLDSRVGGKAVVHHGFQDCALIPSGENPYLYHLAAVLLVVYVSHCVIVHREGCDEGLDLVPQLLEDIGLLLLRLRAGAADHQIVHIQLGLAHVQGSSSQSGNVILKGSKFQCDLVRFFAETLQLLRHRLRRGNLVCLLSAVGHHLIHDLEEPL
ncbi:hypothetical protein IMSAG185_00432 [Lachnospiraceae bacterium]|nr:hypothetical protein IMSAG185_00432 [Lachnospiraceae bacterium]